MNYRKLKVYQKVWLEFSDVFKYLNNDLFNELSTECSEIGFLLNYMINNPEKYL
jgi:hypothetical protein